MAGIRSFRCANDKLRHSVWLRFLRQSLADLSEPRIRLACRIVLDRLGTVLRKAFTTPDSARTLNLVILFAVAAWLVIPH